MKKLLTLFLIGLVTISCSKDIYNEQETREIIQNNYDRSFINTFGPVGSNVDWGFGDSKVSTRQSHPNSNQWGNPNVAGGIYANVLAKNEIPPITSEEYDKVLAKFSEKGAESYASLVEWNTFFVQHVHKGTAEYTASNGGKVIGGNQMNWLCAYSPKTGNDDHINNFNAAQGEVMLMMESSTSRFGYKSSTDNGHVFYYFRMEEIDGMYYVGFDFSAEGHNPNEIVQRDYIYNDWIVKIIPGNGYPNPAYRVIAEDLNASEASDFDFNDVVFDVVKAENGKTTLKLIACGGIYKLTVGGIEIHGVFGESAKADGTYPMINTGKGPNYEPKEFQINGEYKTPAEIKNIEIRVWKPGTGDDGIELKAQTGKPACKILVNDTFKVVPENKNISNEYGNFTNYVQGKFVDDFWWN